MEPWILPTERIQESFQPCVQDLNMQKNLSSTAGQRPKTHQQAHLRPTSTKEVIGAAKSWLNPTEVLWHEL